MSGNKLEMSIVSANEAYDLISKKAESDRLRAELLRYIAQREKLGRLGSAVSQIATGAKKLAAENSVFAKTKKAVSEAVANNVSSAKEYAQVARLVFKYLSADAKKALSSAVAKTSEGASKVAQVAANKARSGKEFATGVGLIAEELMPEVSRTTKGSAAALAALSLAAAYHHANKGSEKTVVAEETVAPEVAKETLEPVAVEPAPALEVEAPVKVEATQEAPAPAPVLFTPAVKPQELKAEQPAPKSATPYADARKEARRLRRNRRG